MREEGWTPPDKETVGKLLGGTGRWPVLQKISLKRHSRAACATSLQSFPTTSKGGKGGFFTLRHFGTPLTCASGILPFASAQVASGRLPGPLAPELAGHPAGSFPLVRGTSRTITFMKHH